MEKKIGFLIHQPSAPILIFEQRRRNGTSDSESKEGERKCVSKPYS